jgi:hypothetical protein
MGQRLDEIMAHRRRLYVLYDPIQILIDKQLAGLWMEAVYIWKSGGKHHWGRMNDGDKTTLNYIEDMMVEALDKKYHTDRYILDIIMELKIQGYTNHEIALLTGISQRTVERYMKELREKGVTNGRN